jgi:ABC-2 type transport system permease protein
VVGASLYIIGCSAKNRFRERLRRLREPRYVVGAIVGVAYVYFSFFARFRAARGGAARRRAGGAPLPEAILSAVRAGAPAGAGFLLLALTTVSWLVPLGSGLLDFSDSETQFLFPAPVTRRALLLHRLLRSQLGILFGSMILGLASPIRGSYARMRMALAMWLLLCTAKIYATGVSLARARLGSHQARVRRVAWLPVGVLVTALAIVGARLMGEFYGRPVTGVEDGLSRMATVAAHGLSGIVLWPFRAVAAPLFAAWPQPYLAALAGSALVLAACVAWVLASDGTFQDAAEEIALRKTSQPDARRASHRRPRLVEWTLAPTGRAETAFAWKAAMQTTRGVDRRSLARIALLLLALTTAAVSVGRANGLAATLGVFATVAAIFSVLMAPQVLRLDMRQDLRHLELLKTWPVKPGALVRGELAWPGVLITAAAWSMIGLALFLSATVFVRADLSVRLSAGVAAAILSPALVFAQLVIQNGVALIFPAWVPLGSQRARGVDALGQRLILLGGTWLSLLVMLIPGAIPGGVVWFAFRRLMGVAAFVPAAAVCAAVMAIEVLVATEALGPVYERLDVTAVERVE